MKKTLAAVAVLGAFAGSALAADVTLYGRIDTIRAIPLKKMELKRLMSKIGVWPLVKRRVADSLIVNPWFKSSPTTVRLLSAVWVRSTPMLVPSVSILVL